MEIEETNWKGTLAEMLESISTLEDDEPRKGTKAHKEWQNKLLIKYKAYNEKVGWKAFKENL